MHKWCLSKIKKPRGVFIAVHGLNNNPSVMDPQIEVLNALGYHALQITLTAHNKNNPKSKHDGSRKVWLNDFKNAINLTRSKYPDLALYCLCYSMGCTISLNYLLENPESNIKKLVFFAPAICLSNFSKLVRFITPFRFLRFSIPSAIPEGLYAHKYTSIYSLKGLEDLVKFLNNNSLKVISKTKALVFSCPKDKLLDHNALIAWTRKNHLENWHTVEIIPKDGVHYSDHLFLDKDHIERPDFSQIVTEIENFLEN